MVVIFRSLIATIVFLGLSARDADAAEIAALLCSKPPETSLLMTRGSDGHALIVVGVNNKPFNFAVDTGGIRSVISKEAANSLGLYPIPDGENYRMLFGTYIFEQAHVDLLLVGNLGARKFPFMVAPLGAIAPPTDGLIGSDILQKYDVDLNFKYDQFALYSAGVCDLRDSASAVKIPMKFDRSWHIALPVLLDGKPVTAIADTGAPVSVMSMDVAKSLFQIDEKTPGMEKLDDPRASSDAPGIYRYTFSKLSIGGVELQNPTLLLLQQKTTLNFDDSPQLILGLDFLSHYHVHVSYQQGALYLAPFDR